MLKRNWIDKALDYVAPGRSVKREKNRVELAKLQKQRNGFEGAKHGRDDDSWNINGNGSNNIEVSQSLPFLRQRSKALWRNNPYIHNAIKRIGNNVVGSGILPSAKGVTPKQKAQLKQAWENWGETTQCDFYGRLNFYGLEKLVMKTMAKTGDCFIRIIRTPFQYGMPAIQLQVIDVELIDHTKSLQNYNSDNGYIRNGIEYDRYGRVTAYWLFDRHPNEFAVKSSVRIPGHEMLHVMVIEDPGQEHGLPFVTPSIVRAKDLDMFEDAQLVRQKTASCFAAFVTEDGGGDDTEKEELEILEPGRIQYLSPGKQVTFGSPPDSGLAYDPYTKNLLRSISAGMGTSYEIMTNDYSNVNFSSARAGWIEFTRNVEEWQWQAIVPMFCEKVWDIFIEACWFAQTIDFGLRVKATWTTPRREMIDPLKEVQALSAQVRNGFVSYTEAVKSQGFDPDEVLQEIVKEQKTFDEYGLQLACDPRKDPNRPHDPEEEKEKEVEENEVQ